MVFPRIRKCEVSDARNARARTCWNLRAALAAQRNECVSPGRPENDPPSGRAGRPPPDSATWISAVAIRSVRGPPVRRSCAVMSVTTLPTFSPVSDVAKRAGLSEWTIRQEIKKGNLRARRIGRCLRIVDEAEARWVRGTDAGQAS